jgi:hypothetical protein
MAKSTKKTAPPMMMKNMPMKGDMTMAKGKGKGKGGKKC